MSSIRRLAKSCVVLLLGRKSRPRMIVRGLASGYRISVSPAEHLSYLLGTHEPHLQKIIRECVAAGDTVYDIGANIGYVSLLLAKRVGASGRVVAFEPVPQNIASLRRNIAVNRINNVQLLEFAASDKPGEAVIRIAENLATASLVWHRNDPCATELGIQTVAIDQLVDAGELGRPTFVKIDVEGAESAVLNGMRRTISAARPVVFIECSDLGRETSWNLFLELKYRCQSAISRKWVDVFEEYRHADFLWLPA
ncbi:MAG: FkbM family methyltransferase [Candidatus Sulfotelmatobacter sp.]